MVLDLLRSLLGPAASAQQQPSSDEERFRSLFQLSPDGVCVTVLETSEIIEINDSFVAMSGYSRADLMGRTTRELGLWARQEHRDQVYALVRREGICRRLS